MRTKRDPAQNSDLWKELLELLAKHEVVFFWVKGHADNEYNIRCDELASKAAENIKKNNP